MQSIQTCMEAHINIHIHSHTHIYTYIHTYIVIHTLSSRTPLYSCLNGTLAIGAVVGTWEPLVDSYRLQGQTLAIHRGFKRPYSPMDTLCSFFKNSKT